MSYQDIDSSQQPIRINFSSVKSLLSEKSSLQPYVNNNRFPFRPTINMALIILITFQVYLVVSSHMYLRGSLVRSFLQIYADDDKYPKLFQGQDFYLNIKNISQVKQNLEYTFEQMTKLQKNSFLEINIKHSKIMLSIEYLNNLQLKQKKQSQFIIDPHEGIKQPFDMDNITQIQKFLVQINWFKIIIQNITVQNQGFYQKYYHQVTWDFQDGLQISVDFKFSIDNAMLNSVRIDKPQANYLLVMKLFYLIILVLSLMSLYFNYKYVRRTMIVIFKQLGNKPYIHSQKRFVQLNAQDMAQINQAVLNWVKINQLTLQQLTFKHYFYILQFDIICSILSNLFSIIGSIYLLIELEKQIIIGISCFMAWLTIFKFLKRKKKLVLMYQLIKLSFIKIIFFFIQFFPVFLAYTLLGLCLFPKVRFFSTLSKSVTTLVSLMMGDSIQMIAASAMQKQYAIVVIVYIFTFVLLFMHAIHNTLTALIKQAFILKKIQLINDQKKKKKQSDYLYLAELKSKADQEKQQLPVKFTHSLKKQIFRINHLKQSNNIQLQIKKWLKQFEKIFYNQKWQIQQNQQILTISYGRNQYYNQLKRRLTKISQFLNCQQSFYPINTQNKNIIQSQSLITNN